MCGRRPVVGVVFQLPIGGTAAPVREETGDVSGGCGGVGSEIVLERDCESLKSISMVVCCCRLEEEMEVEPLVRRALRACSVSDDAGVPHDDGDSWRHRFWPR